MSQVNQISLVNLAKVEFLPGVRSAKPSGRYMCTVLLKEGAWSALVDLDSEPPNLRFLVDEAPSIPPGAKLDLYEGPHVVGSVVTA